MEKWIFLMLAVNLICTAIFLLTHLRRGQALWVVLFFVFLPGLGFIIYYIPQIIQKIFKMGSYDRESLVNRLHIESALKHPSMSSELNIVPVEDAMSVGKNEEKRTLLLDQLRKNMYGNYKELLAAENDNDSESAHYISAAKMEVYRSRQGEMLRLIKAYEADLHSAEAYHQMMSALKEFIESKLLSERERELYCRKYCSFVELQMEENSEILLLTEQETYLKYQVEMGQYEKVESIWKRLDIHSEKAYLDMLRLFYDKRDKVKFDECFCSLKADSQVQLSAEGLEKVRFWLEREKQDVVS